MIPHTGTGHTFGHTIGHTFVTPYVTSSSTRVVSAHVALRASYTCMRAAYTLAHVYYDAMHNLAAEDQAHWQHTPLSMCGQESLLTVANRC